MTDPFAIQIPEGARPVHGRRGRFLFRKRNAHLLDDYTVSEGHTPYLGVSADARTSRAFFSALLLVLGLFATRAAYLQLGRGEYYAGIAEGNRIRIEELPATRGLIFDRNGRPLAGNAAQFVLAVRPIDFPRDEATRKDIFGALFPYGIFSENILEILVAHPRSAEWIPVQSQLEHSRAIELAALLYSASGLAVRRDTRREYFLEDVLSLSHLLGYAGRPSKEDLRVGRAAGPTHLVGKTGLEAAYELELHGTDGRRRVEVDALGNEKEVLAREDPEDGAHLLLHLDFELQKVSEAIAQRYLKVSRRSRVAVVLLDPRDDAIRALVSLPSFDANAFGAGLPPAEYQALLEDENHPLFPRAISGTYPSGSTIKPLVAVGALAENIITPSTTINSTGGLRVGSWFFPDWRSGGHGPTNVYHAIADSVNTFFYYIGGGYGEFEGLGPDRLALWAKRFGLGVATGVDLPGEAAGFVPTVDWKNRERNEPWYIGDTYHLAIGQGDVLVTPLQMAVATAAIANGGTRYEPRLVRALGRADGEEGFAPAVRAESIVAPEHLRTVREAMRRTVTAGSASSMQVVPVAVAGKTGTAEWSSKAAPHSWFIGFAPYDRPEIAIAVLVEEGGGEGSTAVPIAREILAWYFNQRSQ